MSRKIYCAVSLWGSLFLLTSAETANAQWFGNPCCCCCQPTPQVCYQTVPVTEYQQVRQTVQRPVIEQKWVDHEVTDYVPVTEQRTADVPTLTYADVVENHTCTRDMGGWHTSYYCNPKMSPCQYDPRPGFIGWLNRTTYSLSAAMTPDVYARRQYVPNVVAYNVPVTRRIAQTTTRKVAYNITRLVPQTTTRKVAINTVRYVSEDVVQTQPVTVMRTLPIGSTFAFGISPYGTAPQTVLAPTQDPIGGGSRSADRSNDQFQEGAAPGKFSRPAESSNLDNKGSGTTTRKISQPSPPSPETVEEIPVPRATHDRPVPSVVRVGRSTPPKPASQTVDSDLVTTGGVR